MKGKCRFYTIEKSTLEYEAQLGGWVGGRLGGWVGGSIGGIGGLLGGWAGGRVDRLVACAAG